MSQIIRFYTPEPTATGVYLVQYDGPVVIALVHKRIGRHLDFWLSESIKHRSWQSIRKSFDGASLAYAGNPFEKTKPNRLNAKPTPWEQPVINTEEQTS